MAFNMNKYIGLHHWNSLQQVSKIYRDIPTNYGVDNWFSHILGSSTSLNDFPVPLAEYFADNKLDEFKLEKLQFVINSLFESMLRLYYAAESEAVYRTQRGLLFKESCFQTVKYFLSAYLDKFAIADVVIHVPQFSDRVMDSTEDELIAIIAKERFANTADAEIDSFRLSPSDTIAELKYIMAYEIKEQSAFNTPLGISLYPYIDTLYKET